MTFLQEHLSWDRGLPFCFPLQHWHPTTNNDLSKERLPWRVHSYKQPEMGLELGISWHLSYESWPLSYATLTRTLLNVYFYMYLCDVEMRKDSCLELTARTYLPTLSNWVVAYRFYTRKNLLKITISVVQWKITWKAMKTSVMFIFLKWKCGCIYRYRTDTKSSYEKLIRMKIDP